MKVFSLWMLFVWCFIGQIQGQEMKRGYYPDGKLRYQGYFKEGKPVGELLRYYPEGKLKAKMNYEGDTVSAVLYAKQGDFFMSGKYFQQKKTGIWTFFKGDKLVAREEYREGVLNGTSVRFTDKGDIIEERHWKGGKLDGEWRLFFPDGDLRLQAFYVAGELDGEMVSYFPDGQLRAKGRYKRNLREGEWVFYDASGELVRKRVYHQGRPEDAEEREMEENRELDALINSGKKIPDPAVFVDDPEAYMRLTGME
ncbi:MAG: hypothetical protein K2I90_12505 [Odoribacter sp.]|nr:hypothetical protein [Odoribacter sp.]